MKVPEKKVFKEGFDGDLTLSHLAENKKCYIMVYKYGEIASVSLNKTQVKGIIKWLESWIKFRESSNKKGEK